MINCSGCWLMVTSANFSRSGTAVGKNGLDLISQYKQADGTLSRMFIMEGPVQFAAVRTNTFFFHACLWQYIFFCVFYIIYQNF